MPTPNAELLRRTLDHIKANPAEWNQDQWRCDTAMCFAGWSATLAGCTWIRDDNYQSHVVAEPADVWSRTMWVGRLDHTVVHVSERARRVLGLTSKQAVTLFSPDNGLDDLERIVGELCAQAEAEDGAER